MGANMTTAIIPPLPLSIRQALDTAVGGERILWAAQPGGNRQLTGFGICLFAVPWTVFALCWESMAIMPWFASKGMPEAMMWSFGGVFPLFGLPFILVGFWMLYQPIRAILRAKQTVYALTERRLISLVIGPKTEMTSVIADRIGPISSSAGRVGWGRMSVQTHSRIDSEGDRITERLEMTGIPDVAGLERRLMELQRLS